MVRGRFVWFQVGFSYFQLGFHVFSCFQVENTLKLYFCPTIQSRPSKMKNKSNNFMYRSESLVAFF